MSGIIERVPPLRWTAALPARAGAATAAAW